MADGTLMPRQVREYSDLEELQDKDSPHYGLDHLDSREKREAMIAKLQWENERMQMREERMQMREERMPMREERMPMREERMPMREVAETFTTGGPYTPRGGRMEARNVKTDVATPVLVRRSEAQLPVEPSSDLTQGGRSSPLDNSLACRNDPGRLEVWRGQWQHGGKASMHGSGMVPHQQSSLFMDMDTDLDRDSDVILNTKSPRMSLTRQSPHCDFDNV